MRAYDSPVRYIIRDTFLRSRCLALFYSVDEDGWTTSRAGATQFRRRAIAEAVAAALETGGRVLRLTRPDRWVATQTDDELRPEYTFRDGVRGKYARR